jgi:hypothetical protein
MALAKFYNVELDGVTNAINAIIVGGSIPLPTYKNVCPQSFTTIINTMISAGGLPLPVYRNIEPDYYTVVLNKLVDTVNVNTSVSSSVGAAHGVSTVTSVGARTQSSVGASTGVSAVAGVGTVTPSTITGVGTAAGVGTGVGRSASTAASVGASAAASTVTGSSVLVYNSNFLALSALPAEFSLSRSTTGTRFNSAGTLVIEAINAARFDTYPRTFAGRGILNETSATNYILASSDFTDGSVWSTPSGSTSTGWTGPDASGALAFTTPSGTGGLGSIHSHHGLVSGNTYTSSVYAHAVTGRYQWFSETERNGLRGVAAVFDLAGTSDTTATQTLTYGGATIASTKAVYIGNGIFRLSITWSMALSFDSVYTNMGSADAATGNTQASGWGNVVSTNSNMAGFWGFQLEDGSYASSFVYTLSSAAVTRSADALSSNSPLTGYLAAGPSVWEFEDEATGTISRTAYAAGAFNWPTGKWYRSMGAYLPGTNTSSYLTVGSPYY